MISYLLVASLGACIGFVLCGLLAGARENKAIDRAFERGLKEGQDQKVCQYEAIIHNQRVALRKFRQEEKAREEFESACA